MNAPNGMPDMEVLEERHAIRVRCDEISKVHTQFWREWDDAKVAALLTVAYEIRELREALKQT